MINYRHEDDQYVVRMYIEDVQAIQNEQNLFDDDLLWKREFVEIHLKEFHQSLLYLKAKLLKRK
jgi:hypothetical protein